MFAAKLKASTGHPLDAVRESDLALLARAADPLLAGRPLQSSGGHPNRQRAGQGHQFLDYRDYATGDDLRNLDWRATARSRHPQLRRFHDEEGSDWHICLDCSASMGINGGHKWGKALQLTAAFGYLLLHLGHRVALLGFSDRCLTLRPPGRGRHHYAALARQLRELLPRDSGGASDLLRCLPHLPPRQQLIVISDFLEADGMHSALDRLAGSGRPLHLIQIGDAGQFNLTASGSVELLDVESGERSPRLLTPALVASARQAQQRLDDDLASFCARRAIRHTMCDASAPWKEVVMRHLRVIRAGHG